MTVQFFPGLLPIGTPMGGLLDPTMTVPISEVPTSSQLAGEGGFMDRLMDPRSRMLMAMGANMLANSGPSLTPRSTGQILGGGLQAGLQAYGAGLHEATRRALLKRKLAAEDREQRGQEQVGKLIDQHSRGLIDRTQLISALGQIPDYQNEALRAATAETKPPEAPTTRERTDGNQIIEEEWNPKTGRWEEVSRGPRYKADKPTISGVVAPLLAKVARGEPLTSGEQDVLDYQARVDVLDKLLRGELESMDFTTGSAQPSQTDAQVDSQQILSEARAAIQQGADPEAVRRRLQEMGVDPRLLDASGTTSR